MLHNVFSWPVQAVAVNCYDTKSFKDELSSEFEDSGLVICFKHSDDLKPKKEVVCYANADISGFGKTGAGFSEMTSDTRNVLSLTTVSENLHFLPEKGREVRGLLSWVVDLQGGDQGQAIPMRREENVVMTEGAGNKKSLVWLMHRRQFGYCRVFLLSVAALYFYTQYATCPLERHLRFDRGEITNYFVYLQGMATNICNW